MKRYTFRGAGRLLGGYTLIEVLIFLSVSGALLLAAMNLITGRQDRVRFSQAVVSLEQQFADTFNDVSTGYFPSNSDFGCTTNGYNVNLSASPSNAEEQGTNEGCIFAGKLLHFYAGQADTEYRIYTLVGKRGAKTLGEAQIKLLGNTVGNPGVVDIKRTDSDLQLDRFPTSSAYAIVDPAYPTNRYHSIVVLSELEGTGANNSVTGNATKVKLYGYRCWDRTTGILNTAASCLVPIQQNAVVCLQQSDTGREAALAITTQLTIERQIDQQPSICP